MKTTLLLLSILFASHVLGGLPEPESTTYRVEQTVTLSGIPEGAQKVKWWIAIPDDERFQEVLDFSVESVPGKWEVARELDHGNRFMYVEVDTPKSDSLQAKVGFTLRRQTVQIDVDPEKVGPITDSHRQLFAEELKHDERHMTVTQSIRDMADQACGNESNVAVQARQLLDAVADYANHYSTDSSVPSCSIGDAGACMEAGGGCCTDLHSLFISLARSRGIPARLQMGYRLREANEGKEVDPGYRCWSEYFVPEYGWIPADIVEADDPGGLGRDRWFTGLTSRRLWLNQGREFDLAGRDHVRERVSTVVIGYAEVDGVPVRVLPDEVHGIPSQLARTVRYTEANAKEAFASNQR